MSSRAMLLLALLTIPATVSAQDRNRAFMVQQLSICSGEALAEFNSMGPTVSGILNGLVEEGMIQSWYELRHGWGDEYNLGLVTVAASHRAWLDFWSEYLSRLQQALPDAAARMATLCTVHKDNMYVVRDSGR